MPGAEPSCAATSSMTLIQMMTGYWVSQAIYVAAKLGVADQLRDGPQPVQVLATATLADVSALRRVLRALASVGVFTETGTDVFALTPIAALLRTETPDSLQALAVMYGEEQYQAWGNFLHSVKTGERAFDQVFSTNYFAYLAQHPDSDHVFNHAMTGWTAQLVGAVIDAYDFSPFKTVVDVGGSYGTLLAAILLKHAYTRGILFDQPHVVTAAEEHLARTSVGDRCETIGGDFFIEIPSGGDAYLLAQILHDWDDERSIAILRQCRRAMPAHGKLLVIDLVLPEGDEPFFGKWLDLHMLVMLGARERTAAEHKALFNVAGLELSSVTATRAGPSIVEAVPIG